MRIALWYGHAQRGEVRVTLYRIAVLDRREKGIRIVHQSVEHTIAHGAEVHAVMDGLRGWMRVKFKE